MGRLAGPDSGYPLRRQGCGQPGASWCGSARRAAPLRHPSLVRVFQPAAHPNEGSGPARSQEKKMPTQSVRDLMTENPTCCLPHTPLTEAARLMRDEVCGLIPIVESQQNRRLLGVIT